MRFEQHLRTFLSILQAFENDMPLARFLQKYFRQNKQMGSSDRRSASNLLYNYFRLGRACPNLPAEERLFIAQFLCGSDNDPFLDHFKPELNQKIEWPLNEKIEWLEKQSLEFRLQDVFPCHSHLPAEINKRDFLTSLFIQPDLFIRLYPENAGIVKKKLDQEEIPYNYEGDLTLRLPNGTKLDHLFPENNPEPGKQAAALFEVQDLSSQRTGTFFQPDKYDYWWDACAASGGKSLLLHQQEPNVKLLVSDMRDSVLDNLSGRFLKAGLSKFQKKRLDLTQNPDPDIHDYKFDGIILDIPCSGSGTWGRTPEMISQFHEGTIQTFQKLQQSISSNVVKYLKPGKPLIYITCSVFREENEDMVDFITSKFGLRVESSDILKGYMQKADTMFVARLVKPE